MTDIKTNEEVLQFINDKLTQLDKASLGVTGQVMNIHTLCHIDRELTLIGNQRKVLREIKNFMMGEK